jgi:dicarboxylate transporter 10
MQTIDSSGARPAPSALMVIRTTISNSGTRSLYTGLTASLLRQMTYSLVRIGSYEEIKRLIAKHHPPTTRELLLAASIAGGLGGVVGNPAGKYFYFLGTLDI